MLVITGRKLMSLDPLMIRVQTLGSSTAFCSPGMANFTVELLAHRFYLSQTGETPGTPPSLPRVSLPSARIVKSRFKISSNLVFHGTRECCAARFTAGRAVRGRIEAGNHIRELRGLENGPCRTKDTRNLTLAAVGSRKDGKTREIDGELEEEARAAVIKVLVEGGLSEDEACFVVSKARGFLADLVRKFTESEEELELLDQLQWSSRKKVESPLADKFLDDDSRARLQQLASKSNGLVPFLESLGVDLPSTARISYTLSSQRLPELLRKTDYVKEILIAAVHDGRPVDDLMRRMMKNFSLSADEELQRTLSFYEKVEARRGLGALKEAPYALVQLIDSFPQIFLRDLENEIKPTMQLMEEYGIPKEKLGRVILCFPPVLLKDVTAELRPRTRELKKVGVAARDYGRMIVKYPWLLSQCVADNVEETFKLLDLNKVLKSKIDGIITRCPQLLGFSSTAALVPMIEHLKKYGVKSKRLGRVIALAPQILTLAPQEFDEVVAFLTSYGYEANDIDKLLKRAPEIFAASIHGTLQRKVDFLLELGVKRNKLNRIIRFYPEILSMSVDDALRPRVRYLRSKGFANNEISRMIFKFPPLLGYNAESVLSPKLEFLTDTMKRPIKDVLSYPKYFSFSLEKKIKPRARVLANRQIECDLQTMLGKNDDQFAAEFLGFETMYLPPIK